MSTHLPFQALTEQSGPVLPDISTCHPFYGQQLSAEDCWLAAGQLPTGSEPVEFGLFSGEYRPYDIPLTTINQACQVRVSFVYVDSYSNLYNAGIQVIPDKVRDMAGWLLRTCVIRGGGLGGFGTIGIQNMISFLTDYETTTSAIGNGP